MSTIQDEQIIILKFIQYVQKKGIHLKNQEDEPMSACYYLAEYMKEETGLTAS